MGGQARHCKCKKETGRDKYGRIAGIIDEYKGREDCLIQILHQSQAIFGYLPPELQQFIADRLDKPLSEISKAVTYHTFLHDRPKGEFTIKVCMGTTCYIRGGRKILDRLRETYGIDAGETTADGKYTLEIVRCMGACSMAPVLSVNDRIYSGITLDRLLKIIEKLDQGVLL